jgi:glucokinase
MSASDRGPVVVGIDLGGTKILAAVIDADNRILGRAKVSTPAKEGNTAVLTAVLSCAEQALTEAGIRRDQVAGIGIGSPGPLDVERGVIVFSANMNVRDFALGPDLARALGRPVLIQNDVRVGGWGEFRLGAGRGHRSVLAAFVGTGIGGCLILDENLVTGATGNAGEVGHAVVKANGPECGCGRRGCLEALASRTAIARRIRKALRKGAEAPLAAQLVARSEKLKSRDLAAAYGAGDPVVVKEVHRAARMLGLGLGGLVNVFGPEIVIIGGGVAAALGDPYIEMVRAAARLQILVDPEHRIEIVPAALGDDSGILGAALLARAKFAGS